MTPQRTPGTRPLVSTPHPHGSRSTPHDVVSVATSRDWGRKDRQGLALAMQFRLVFDIARPSILMASGSFDSYLSIDAFPSTTVFLLGNRSHLLVQHCYQSITPRPSPCIFCQARRISGTSSAPSRFNCSNHTRCHGKPAACCAERYAILL